MQADVAHSKTLKRKSTPEVLVVPSESRPILSLLEIPQC
jgi:hypothetical protein